jgi:hypothetical protein
MGHARLSPRDSIQVATASESHHSAVYSRRRLAAISDSSDGGVLRGAQILPPHLHPLAVERVEPALTGVGECAHG